MTKGRRGTTVAAPPVLKLLEGRAPGRDSGGRAVKLPPGFRRLPPEPPTWLPVHARAEWDRVVPELARLELLKPADGPALVAYVLAWDRLVRAQADLDREGMYVASNANGTVRHPAVTILADAARDLRVLGREFGLTPSSEAALSVHQAAPDDDDNPFAG